MNAIRKLLFVPLLAAVACLAFSSTSNAAPIDHSGGASAQHAATANPVVRDVDVVAAPADTSAHVDTVSPCEVQLIAVDMQTADNQREPFAVEVPNVEQAPSLEAPPYDVTLTTLTHYLVMTSANGATRMVAARLNCC